MKSLFFYRYVQDRIETDEGQFVGSGYWISCKIWNGEKGKGEGTVHYVPLFCSLQDLQNPKMKKVRVFLSNLTKHTDHHTRKMGRILTDLVDWDRLLEQGVFDNKSRMAARGKIEKRIAGGETYSLSDNVMRKRPPFPGFSVKVKLDEEGNVVGPVMNYILRDLAQRADPGEPVMVGDEEAFDFPTEINFQMLADERDRYVETLRKATEAQKAEEKCQ